MTFVCTYVYIDNISIDAISIDNIGVYLSITIIDKTCMYIH